MNSRALFSWLSRVISLLDRRISRFVYVVFVVKLSCLPVLGTTITVTNTNDSGSGSLRAALANANDGDTINFSVGGSIFLTSGELVILNNVTIAGPGSSVISIDGNANSTIFHIISDVAHGRILTVSISGLTIMNADNGPGINNDGGTLTLNNCMISGNTNACDTCPGLGGGIFNDGHQFENQPTGSATLHVSNCTITGNYAGQGGGINNNGGIKNGVPGSATFDITNSNISGNFAGGGAGIYHVSFIGATSTITDCILDSNHAFGPSGGAIVNVDSHMSISGTTLSNNTSSLEVAGTIQSYSDCTQGECTASLTLSNSTVTHVPNIPNHNGVIENDNATMLISHCTFTGDPFVIYLYDCGTLEIGHTILGLGGGTNGAEIENQDGTVVSDGYNISNGPGVHNSPFVGCTAPTGQLNGTGDHLNTDPKLDPNGLQDNGGPTRTIALLSNSPAIDAGDPNFAPPPSHDQRGYPRIIGARVDVGAFEYEFGGRLHITSSSRSGADNVVVFQAIQGVTYRLERVLSLTPSPSWQSIPGVNDLTVGSTGPAQIIDPGAASLSKDYYRVRLLP